MKEITIQQFNENPFTLIGEKWMLISAEKQGKVNTMTASWGGLGHLWNKNVVFIFIRPQRYTKEFVDANEFFTCSFFDGHKKELGYLGRISGKDEDKIAQVDFHLANAEPPVFEEAKMTLVCRKLYAQELKEENFVDHSLMEKCYPLKDYHTVYVGEIEKILINE